MFLGASGFVFLVTSGFPSGLGFPFGFFLWGKLADKCVRLKPGPYRETYTCLFDWHGAQRRYASGLMPHDLEVCTLPVSVIKGGVCKLL